LYVIIVDNFNCPLERRTNNLTADDVSIDTVAVAVDSNYNGATKANIDSSAYNQGMSQALLGIN
jgi:hypothetical protein